MNETEFDDPPDRETLKYLEDRRLSLHRAAWSVESAIADLRRAVECAEQGEAQLENSLEGLIVDAEFVRKMLLAKAEGKGGA